MLLSSNGSKIASALFEAKCLIFTVGVGISCFERGTENMVLQPNARDVDLLFGDFLTLRNRGIF